MKCSRLQLQLIPKYERRARVSIHVAWRSYASQTLKQTVSNRRLTGVDADYRKCENGLATEATYQWVIPIYMHPHISITPLSCDPWGRFRELAILHKSAVKVTKERGHWTRQTEDARRLGQVRMWVFTGQLIKWTRMIPPSVFYGIRKIFFFAWNYIYPYK